MAKPPPPPPPPQKKILSYGYNAKDSKVVVFLNIFLLESILKEI